MWREKKEKEIKVEGEREGAGYYYCSEEAAEAAAVTIFGRRCRCCEQLRGAVFIRHCDSCLAPWSQPMLGSLMQCSRMHTHTTTLNDLVFHILFSVKATPSNNLYKARYRVVMRVCIFLHQGSLHWPQQHPIGFDKRSAKN